MRSASAGQPAAQDALFAGGGAMGALMRSTDWSRTLLGPVQAWPQALKTSVRIMLTSRQPMFVWWGDELINLYNDAYRDILGGKHPQALGQPAAVVWREIWDQVGPRAQSALRGNEGTYDEALLLIMERHGYPEETYYTFSYSPVPNDEGGTGGILCANTNDTQRIIGERQLALLRELAAGTADARTVAEACALSARCLETNPYDLPFALIYLLDRERQRVVLAGRTRIVQGHPAAPTTVALEAGAVWPFGEVVRTNSPCVVSRLPTLPSGAWDRPPNQAVALPIPPSGQTGQAGILIVGLNPYRLFDADYERFLGLVAGQIAAAIANAQAYEAERARAEALAELDRAKTLFFSNVSHEFRTPLTLLLGPLEDALADAEQALAEAQRERLVVAHRNALRLLRLVNTLLDFSRIEAGRVQATYEATDLPTVTADLASTFRSAVERAGLRLVVDCPPLPAGVETYVDQDMWEKIVLNLLSNAFKFTFAGEIAVCLRPAVDGRTVELTVRDTGTGIPAAELPRLFERFHRVEGSRARTQEGTGIGLALVQELVKLHGGTVSVESVLGSGTTFTVTIPTGAAHLPPDRIGAGRSRASSATGAAPYVEEALRWLPGAGDAAEVTSGANDWALAAREFTSQTPTADARAPGAPRARVLLADDNADMREYVARLLGQRYDVETVSDGAAALAAARARPPDLVLSDVMMPGLDGFELLRALRADPRTRELPVILLSARAGEEARVEGLDAGADDYLVKPFAARELLARVGTHLTLARLRAEATGRERAARAEAETERARLRELFEQAPAAVAVLRGPQHVFELANLRYVEIAGRHREYLGRPAREVFPEVAGQSFFELLDRVYRTGEPFVGMEMPMRLDRRGDGTLETVYFNFVYQPIKSADGQVEGIFVHAVDVTEHVHARQQLEAEVAERQRAVRARDEFLSIAAHELRTPLTTIKGTVQLALRAQTRGALDLTRAERTLRTIGLAADRLATLTDDLLDVARLQSGQLALRPRPIDVAALVRAILEQQAEQMGDGHVLAADLPPGPITIEADPGRLEQIIDNLLSNAVKYSPGGGPITVTLGRDEGGVTLAVRDSGIGLPAGAAERIFQPFGRAANATAHSLPGLGLGLYISRRIAELHGGRLWAESAGEGCGTTMRLWLPTAPRP